MREPMLLLALLCLLRLSGAVFANQSLPILGWSTWNTFRLDVNATLIQASALNMAQGPLKKAGYRYILLDDGWPQCLKRDTNSKCLEPAPRSSSGEIVPDPKRFPQGMKPVVEYVHSLGLKIGIYTAVSARTCGGYTGSLNHEATDAATFVRWGFDFVKHDTCNTDCGIHDGCIQASTGRMRASLQALSPYVIYYLDSGNPTSPQRVFNPHNRLVTNKEALVKVATHVDELVWVWAHDTAHMFKSWFDMADTWVDTLTNAHNQIRVGPYQRCGFIHTPDMLTVGMGGMSDSEYRVQFFLWVVLGAPLVLGNDIRHMDKTSIELVTNTELIAVDQDPDCVQGSMVRALGATEVWLRPLHDDTFAGVLVNKGTVPQNVTVHISSQFQWGDFYPANLDKVQVRDLFQHKDLGVYDGLLTLLVPPHDARMLKFTPIA